MTTTTSKNVRGTSKFVEQLGEAALAGTLPANEAAAKERYAAEAKEKATVDKPYPDVEHLQTAERGPLMIVIDGAGTMPLMDNNGRRIMRGEPVEVSEEEADWLARGGSEFKRV